MDATQPTQRRSAAANRMTALVVLLRLCASTGLTACGGSSTSASNSPSVSMSEAASASPPSPTPLAAHAPSRGERLAVARTVEELRDDPEADYSAGTARVVGYYVLIWDNSWTRMGVVVESDGTVLTGEKWAWGGPGTRLPPPGWRAHPGVAERWAMRTAAHAVATWTTGLPPRTLFPAHTRRAVVAYEVAWQGKHVTGTSLRDALGRGMAGMSRGR